MVKKIIQRRRVPLFFCVNTRFFWFRNFFRSYSLPNPLQEKKKRWQIYSLLTNHFFANSTNESIAFEKTVCIFISIFLRLALVPFGFLVFLIIPLFTY